MLMAEATSLTSITTSLGSGLQTVANSAMDAIGTVVPYAIPIAGAVIVVSIGIRIFRRIAK